MKKKLFGLSILLIVYLLGVAIGVLGYIAFSNIGLNDYLAVLFADVIATVFVWLMGVIFRTASMYDPYWSVQTLVMYLGLLIKYQNWNAGTIALLIVIAIYSIRLTGNFIIGFDSLSYVDWRYKMLKSKSGNLYQFVNLFGICLFPTMVVYACSLPVIVFAAEGAFSFWCVIGLAIALSGILLEFVSDMQMKKFARIRSSRGEVINIGLWKYSRHPNYLGEITIWFGIALTLIFCNFSYWYLIFGAVINLLMFLFISIPMEEKHLKEYKEDYDIYLEKTSPLLILPRRKKDEKTKEQNNLEN